MGNTGQQLSEGAQFLALMQGFLLMRQFGVDRLAVGQVGGVRDNHRLALEVDQLGGHRTPEDRSVGTHEAGLEVFHRATLDKGLEIGFAGAGVGIVGLRRGRFAEQFGPLPGCGTARCRRAVSSGSAPGRR